MRFRDAFKGIRSIYAQTTLLEGTVHLIKGSWKMLKVSFLSAYWRHNFRRAGKNLTVFPRTRIDRPRNITVGSDFSLNHGSVLRNEATGTFQAGNKVALGMHCLIDYSGGLVLGDDVVISDEAQVHTHNHGLNPHTVPTYRRLTMGSGVWIGGRAIILPQVSSIGDGAVIGAGSVVTKDVPPHCVVAGNPARVIRQLTPPREKKDAARTRT